MKGRKFINAPGIDRALALKDVDRLCRQLGVTAETIRRWRRQDPKGALQRAVWKAGSQVAMAALLGVSQKTVSEWLRRDNPESASEKPPRNAVDRVVALAGGQPKLAEALGVTQQNVSVWVRQGFVPATRAKEIEILYGVSRAELLSPKLRSAAGLGEEL